MDRFASGRLPHVRRAGGALFAVVALLSATDAQAGRAISVASSSHLVNAVQNAMPGDVITLAPGAYGITKMISLTIPGTATAPITIRAARLGDVVITVSPGTAAAEGFRVAAPYWVIENLEMKGSCTSANHGACAHAIHVSGRADGLVVRNNYLHEFNAMIKSSPTLISGQLPIFADRVRIVGNRLQNATGRNTSNPVTFIDINGGDGWLVSGNRIADFYKIGGDQISYGAFLKGNSRNGIFENNLIVGAKRVTTGGYRIGMSFGGGGNTLPGSCENNDCSVLHSNGTMRNNVVMNTSDVGIYLNKAANTKIYNNLLYRTRGIDVRYSKSSAEVTNNILDNSIRGREGGTYTASSNLQTTLSGIYNLAYPADFSLKGGAGVVDLGLTRSAVTTDACSAGRNTTPVDRGPIEYRSPIDRTCSETVRARFNGL
jgi:parallel beta-helix repeat protein